VAQRRTPARWINSEGKLLEIVPSAGHRIATMRRSKVRRAVAKDFAMRERIFACPPAGQRV
jgi:hypothetical protein